MTDITYNKVKKYVEKYGMMKAHDLVIAGVSGGADSVCLLHILKRMQRETAFRLAVVHVDHGVRPDSAADAGYVEKLCQEWEIPFYLRRVNMDRYARDHGLSSEEAGRLLRYESFDEVLKEQKQDGERGRIAVAHNCNDRAETMLFHMFRGSGLKGLGGIPPVREAVIRPLLCLKREEIEKYLEDCHLTYCQDSTNEGDAYTRNRIRHHVLPYAEQEICFDAVTHMGNLAEIVAETERYLEEQTKRLYQIYVEEADGGYDRADYAYRCLRIKSKELLSEDPVMYKRVLLACMERLAPYRKDITGQHIVSLAELMGKDGSKEMSFPYGIKAYKEYDRLYLIRGKQPDIEPLEPAVSVKTVQSQERQIQEMHKQDSACSSGYQVKPPTEISLPEEGVFEFLLLEKEAGFCKKEQNIPQNRYTKWFDYDKITTSLLLRTRQQGDYLTIDAGMHTKSVKQYMINEKIPKMQRDRMHLLADGSHVLWIPGYRISQQYKVDGSTRRILQVRYRGGSNGGTN